ncbi:MAG: DUF3298 domain-containing protein [Bacteroidales bacterium]|nr:DUF3298 domain-containing protein [Bacteroidales bacterium]
MKRLCYFLLAGIFLLSACTNEIRTEKLSLHEEIPFHEGSQFHLTLDYDVDFPVSGFSNTALAKVRQAIRTACFGDAFVDFTAPLKELGQAVRDEQAQTYVQENEAFLRDMEITEDEVNTLDWEFYFEGSFKETYGNYINYMIEKSSYMAGAHGLFSMTPVVFDLTTGQPVSDEVFTGGISRDRLLELLDRYKFEDLADEVGEGVRDEDVFYVDAIEPSLYFSVGEKGITYYYQPYEVAPYVFGVIEITIPWEELQ